MCVHGCWGHQNCACVWWECQGIISKAMGLLVGTCLACGCRLCLGCPIAPISVCVRESWRLWELAGVSRSCVVGSDCCRRCCWQCECVSLCVGSETSAFPWAAFQGVPVLGSSGEMGLDIMLLPEPPPPSLIEARFPWPASPSLAPSFWVGVEQRLWLGSLRSWDSQSLGVNFLICLF